ncbi:hypothetical protein EV360DRAFT_90780 [Lentinula raphanica]|nr:hypothetical protein EV360DRAFT_90780 [Lentinula raphanica]
MCIYDLSKVVLGHKKLLRTLSPELEKFLDRGMRIISLHLYKLDPELISQLDSKVISGLREIRIFSKTVPPSLPWLPVLSSTHPSLNELGFLGGYEQWLNYEGTAPLFLTPLIKESQRQAIDRLFSIRKVDLRRLTVGQPSQEWHVTGLTLKTARASTSLLEILMLVASSFTQLEVLSLDLILHDGIYDIDELTSTFANFSSLRIVYFRQVFRRLNFGPEIETLMPPVEGVDTMHAINKERASVKGRLLFFISCLAKQVRSLDSIHISDYEGDVYDCSDNCIVSWYFEGWLHVLNGKRDVGGRLEN